MASSTTTLPLSAAGGAAAGLCCGGQSVKAGVLSPRAGFERVNGGGVLCWGLSRQVWKTRRKGGGVVRSQVATGMETGVAEDEKVGDSVQTVVIVGAGISGLSAALALHRVGIKVLVLEQTSSIRAAGTSLTLWSNAWRALEYMGVAQGLREMHFPATGVSLYSRDEILLKHFEFTECDGGPHEVRAVHRKLLIEALAAELPAGTIQLNSRVRAVKRKPRDALTKLELENGSTISTKVLLGCDGINSIVGKWMGLSPTRYIGQIGYRGVADFPDGHEFGSTVCQFLGEGSRCGLFPLSPSKVYWFMVVNREIPGPKVSDPSLVKAEVLDLLKKDWPEKMTDLVNSSPLQTLSRSALSDRWNIPGLTPPLVKDGVTLAGDALHPMTPNLGQGGCTAIEDGVILAQTLGEVLSQGEGVTSERIQEALEHYTSERQKRTLGITVRSFFMGLLLGIPFAPVVFIRNKLAVPKLTSPKSFLSHTLYDVGRLPSH